MNTPAWLKDVQNNSWEPEIILSGLTITFIFLLDDSLYNFFAMLIQDFGIRAVGESGYIFSILVLNAVTMVFIFHLLLRGLWTALVGLSFVFPEGVNHDNLPDASKHIRFKSPVDVVMRLEKICSLHFSYVASLILMLIQFAVIVSPIIVVDFFDLSEFVKFGFIGFYIGAFITIAVYTTVKKTSKFTHALYRGYSTYIGHTISSIKQGGVAILLITAMVLLSLPASVQDIKRFAFDDRRAISQPNSGLKELVQENYLDQRNQGLRLQRAAIKQEEVWGDRIKLMISYYNDDEITLAKLKEQKFLSRNRAQSKVASIDDITYADLFSIHIDGVETKPISAYFKRYGPFEQRVLVLTLNKKGEAGTESVLTVNKAFWSNDDKSLKQLERWDELVFFNAPVSSGFSSSSGN